MISDLGLILVVAGIATVLFKRLKQPVVLGYILAGFLVGPHFGYFPTVVDDIDSIAPRKRLLMLVKSIIRPAV